MQQYSRLPGQNTQVDGTEKLLTTIQQLRTELWLEHSLNQLQSRFNDCLSSNLVKNVQTDLVETEIFQALVDELSSALQHLYDTGNVALALIQPQKKLCEVCYVSPSLTQCSPLPVLIVKRKRKKRLRLALHEEINTEDLQELENQQPQSAWKLFDGVGEVMGWLIVITTPSTIGSDLLEMSQEQLISRFMMGVVRQCHSAIAYLRQIRSLQQAYQQLESVNLELRRTNQIKNQFLANTSHEIRTPLSSIIGFTHLLLAQGFDSTKERHQEYLTIIQSSGKHLLALINDILDLSKIEANQLEVQWERVDVPTLCHNILALVKEKAANKGLKLRLELDPKAKTLVADSLRLKQMLLNLLFNALKFTNTGTVGLQVMLQDPWMHFTVWDTGSGISQKHLTELFQPYFRVVSTICGYEEGTGLGLSVTQKLAQLHNGRIEVESQLNSGSRFTVILPLMQDVDEATVIQQENEEVHNGSDTSVSPSSSTARPSLDVLLVEDDVPNAHFMQIYLQRLGYQVIWVKNVTEMWQALAQQHPAVILMDIYLPDNNGLKVIKQLRENPEYQMIPVIAQTAMAMKGDREACLSAGFNDYISKPIDLCLLTNLISKYSKPR